MGLNHPKKKTRTWEKQLLMMGRKKPHSETYERMSRSGVEKKDPDWPGPKKRRNLKRGAQRMNRDQLKKRKKNHQL